MLIEILKKSDLNSYKELIDECFDGSNDISEYKKYNLEANYKIVVAKDGAKIIGSITFYKLDLFTFSFQPVLEIFNVAVLEDYRGQKIAKKLFEFIFDYAKKNGYKSINLTCLDTAIPAHKLYESVGFIRTGSVKYNLYLK
jgi:ribosomal protein S18 acetylase RimI-like enzyme